jgi:Flp pilus assembly protein TadD
VLRGFVAVLFLSAVLTAKSPDWDRAHELYQKTEYTQALTVLASAREKDQDILQLTGQCSFMLADYKKAQETFEKALALNPQNAELHHWLGRAWGRRAETASVFLAPGYASKARQEFEKAYQLDPKNRENASDLFEYYLQAPGFLGGGIEKAADLAKHIGQLDAAEGHYAQAQIAEKRKEFGSAEENLRRAAELAPKQVGRLIDVARYLADRDRSAESDAIFTEAAKVDPHSPKLLYARAETLIRHKRNLDDAKTLLERYLRSELTPDDPPRERARDLLKKIGQ